mgnify:CR=1 FL=1
MAAVGGNRNAGLSVRRMLRIRLMMADSAYDLDLIRSALPDCDIEQWSDCRDWDAETLAARCREVDAVVTGRNSPRLPDELVTDRGRLRLLAHCHGTVKHLVSAQLVEAGLAVSNWGDNVYGVAEGALALLYACLKQIPQMDAFIKNDWSGDQWIGLTYPATLVERDVGLYGCGPIGRHMARILLPLGARVRAYDKYATELPDGVEQVDSLTELFDRSQIVSIHCGLNDETKGSVDADCLARLPKGGIVINTARGGIIDEDALLKELQAKRLIAGLDVISDERHWAQSPLNLPNAIFSGHKVASGRVDTSIEKKKKNLPKFVLTNLLALQTGESLQNLIPPAIFALKT